jgi:1,4-dihydroxy-2-naphthoate octaprenyltransferase
MSKDKTIEVNSLEAWLLASRPKTLAGAAVPVMLGSAYAAYLIGHYYPVSAISAHFAYLPMVLCFLFAFIMQIDANLVNDYYDYRKGNDNEMRLGPQRACQEGWVTLPAMRKAIAFTTLLACLVGMPLICYGGVELIGIGALCVLFCFLYTTMLAGKGLGDILVIIFFGVIPVVFTCYVIVPPTMQDMSQMPWVLSVACGLVVDTLLIVNNFRDIDNDRAVGKRTLVVCIGKRATSVLYLLLQPLALLMVMLSMNITSGMTASIVGVTLFTFHVHTWLMMRVIGEGRGLNKVLGMTARNIFLFGLMVSVFIILCLPY